MEWLRTEEISLSRLAVTVTPGNAGPHPLLATLQYHNGSVSCFELIAMAACDLSRPPLTLLPPSSLLSMWVGPRPGNRKNNYFLFLPTTLQNWIVHYGNHYAMFILIINHDWSGRLPRAGDHLRRSSSHSSQTGDYQGMEVSAWCGHPGDDYDVTATLSLLTSQH